MQVSPTQMRTYIFLGSEDLSAIFSTVRIFSAYFSEYFPQYSLTFSPPYSLLCHFGQHIPTGWLVVKTDSICFLQNKNFLRKENIFCIQMNAY